MDELGIRFADPIYLQLLAVPVLLFCVWLWRFFSRRVDINAYRSKRIVPSREIYLFTGILSVWLCLIFSLAFSIVALARPQKLMSVRNNNPIDLVVILDGSASMYVDDVKPDRWGRSVVWLRNLVETLPWKGDRIALAAFAHKASPMVRLTSDPNVVMFFIDHMKQSPFELRLNTTWDTNMEEGIYWGVKILEKDAALYGKDNRKNPKAFILVSDGQVWSGSTEDMLKTVSSIGPVYVIGVGTTVGGIIPRPVSAVPYSDGGGSAGSEEGFPIVRSMIDRQSLRKIALAAGGEYFELGSESDATIAAKIINRVQKRGSTANKEELWEDLYWYFLVFTAAFLCLGVYTACR